MSSSGDQYYSYGNYSERHGNVVERGIYVMDLAREHERRLETCG